jgi:hypothetical protein
MHLSYGFVSVSDPRRVCAKKRLDMIALVLFANSCVFANAPFGRPRSSEENKVGVMEVANTSKQPKQMNAAART